MSTTREELPARLRATYSEALTLLRIGRAASAERVLRDIQAAAPGEINSLRLLGVALLDQDKASDALLALEQVTAAAPEFWAARADLARAYRRAGRLEQARRELSRTVSAAPALESTWLAYGDVLVELEKYHDAKFAYERARLADPCRERIELASAALLAEDHRRADEIFRDILKSDASHVAALCGLAAGRAGDAVRLLHHALKQSAQLPLAWRGLGQAYLQVGCLTEAQSAVQRLLKIEDENPRNWVLLATVYIRLMRQTEALGAFEEALRLNPREIRLTLSVGHVLKPLGRRQESEAAYKTCLGMDPCFGEAYWSLADLKNYVFADTEIGTMQVLLKGDGGDDLDQAQLHFALGWAFEHKRDYGAAFEHYAAGNRRRRKTVPFSIARFEEKTRRVIGLFDETFLAARDGAGFADPAPIFVVGLPRSGSTLVEQILASHSHVEGTVLSLQILDL